VKVEMDFRSHLGVQQHQVAVRHMALIQLSLCELADQSFTAA
jgi:hypothetical protein